jgi:hypothetical protein
MSDPTLPSFRYRLGQQPPRTDCGGLVRAASVRQFPASQGIGGASMCLQPGCACHAAGEADTFDDASLSIGRAAAAARARRRRAVDGYRE